MAESFFFFLFTNFDKVNWLLTHCCVVVENNDFYGWPSFAYNNFSIICMHSFYFRVWIVDMQWFSFALDSLFNASIRMSSKILNQMSAVIFVRELHDHCPIQMSFFSLPHFSNPLHYFSFSRYFSTNGLTFRHRPGRIISRSKQMNAFYSL